VIGEGDGIETAFFSAVQDVENADASLLVVDGSRGVDMKVDAAPC
jgi:50S ribosomal subunit-associated GTPase HflX